MTALSPLAEHYLQLAKKPINDGDFAGADMRYSGEFETLEGELEKAASLHQTDAIDWQKIRDLSEALLRHHPKRVKQLWLAESRQAPRIQPMLELAAQHRVSVGHKERQELDEWAEGVHQGVVAEVSPSQVWGENMLDELLERREGVPLLLVLDGVTDPHNLGACLRTDDAAGALAVIVPKDKSATLNATVRKVACGAAEVIPLVAVTNLARTLEKLQKKGLWVVGTAGEAETVYLGVFRREALRRVGGYDGRGQWRLRANDTAELPEASGEAIAKEFERYLRRRPEGPGGS